MAFLLTFVFGMVPGVVWVMFKVYRPGLHQYLAGRRRRRPTTDQVILAQAASMAKRSAVKQADWAKVRALEWELDGRYWTGPGGVPLDDDDPAAFVKEDPGPTPQDIAGMTLEEFADLRRRMGMDTRVRKGMYG